MIEISNIYNLFKLYKFNSNIKPLYDFILNLLKNDSKINE